MNKGIKYLIAGVIAAGVALGSYAANIEVTANAQSQTFLANSSGTYTPAGWLVQIGTFVNPTTDGTLPSLLAANWKVFGSGVTAGAGGDFSVDNTADEAGFAHTQLYVVTYNNTTAGGANQWGVYYVNMVNDTGWKIPASTDSPNTTAVDVNSMFANPSVDTSFNPGAHIVFGSAAHDPAFGGIVTLEMAAVTAVPEPSSILLVGVGLLGMLGLIRRRS